MSNQIAKTFFNHRVFVIYKPDDYRRFLVDLVDTGNWREDQRHQLKLGLWAWGTILVYQARMVPWDFNRNLKRLVKQDGGFNAIRPLSFRVYRQQLAMQLGIEAITREPAVQDRIESVPVFGQLIYDTLYLPSYEHESYEPGRALVVTRASLWDYLWQRASAGGDAPPASYPPKDMREFLFDALRRYLQLLCEPMRIRDETLKFADQLSNRNSSDTYDEDKLWRALAKAIDKEPIVDLLPSGGSHG